MPSNKTDDRVAAMRPGDRAAEHLGPLVCLCVVAVGVSLALRALYLGQEWRIDLSEHPVFIADEGVVGLMARHILDGARPLFYYGQSYMGALEAYCVAAVFAVFGTSMRTLRIAPAIWAVAWLPLTYAITRRLYGRRAALLATTLCALPSPFVFEWGFKARGGYAEHVTLLLVIVLCTISSRERPTVPRLSVLGAAIGLSWWVNQLAVAYTPVYCYTLLSRGGHPKRRLAVIAGAAMIGMAPLVYGNIVQPFATVRSLGTEVRSSWRLGAMRAAIAERTQRPDYTAIPLAQVLGAHATRDGDSSIPGIVTGLLLVLGFVWHARRVVRPRAPGDPMRPFELLVFGFSAVTVAIGVSGFFGQPIGRYQLLLYPLLCVTASAWLVSAARRWAVGIVGVLAVAQAVQLATPAASDGRTPRAALIQALTAHDLRYGYSAGFMDDVVLESEERIIIVPVERARYAPYVPLVATAARKFYVYRDDQTGKPVNQAVLSLLAEVGSRYRMFMVGEYHVLYAFEPADSLSAHSIELIQRRVRTFKAARLSDALREDAVD